MSIFAVVVIVAAVKQKVKSGIQRLNADNYLKTTIGLNAFNKRFEACFSRVFWYPCPTPGRIMPFSRRGPQPFPSCLYIGIWLNRMTGSVCVASNDDILRKCHVLFFFGCKMKRTTCEFLHEFKWTTGDRNPFLKGFLLTMSFGILVRVPWGIEHDERMVGQWYFEIGSSEMGCISGVRVWGEGWGLTKASWTFESTWKINWKGHTLCHGFQVWNTVVYPFFPWRCF